MRNVAIVVAVVAVVAMAVPAQADLLLYEGFGYTTTTNNPNNALDPAASVKGGGESGFYADSGWENTALTRILHE